VRYLAPPALGPEGTRVNAISAGPIRHPWRASGIRSFRKMAFDNEKQTPCAAM